MKRKAHCIVCGEKTTRKIWIGGAKESKPGAGDWKQTEDYICSLLCFERACALFLPSEEGRAGAARLVAELENWQRVCRFGMMLEHARVYVYEYSEPGGPEHERAIVEAIAMLDAAAALARRAVAEKYGEDYEQLWNQSEGLDLFTDEPIEQPSTPG